jgi:ribosome-binding factor A
LSRWNRCFSSSSPPGPNPGLASVISQGMESLNTTASQVQAKTKKSLDKWDDGPTPRQIMESQRVMETATECLEEMVVRGMGNLHIQGEPIVLLQVEVNRPLKQAKVYWTLPYGVLLDDRISKNLYRKFMDRLQEHVDAGDAKLLQRQVHARLRSYYPPRLKLVQATDMMVHEAMLELMDEDV